MLAIHCASTAVHCSNKTQWYNPQSSISGEKSLNHLIWQRGCQCAVFLTNIAIIEIHTSLYGTKLAFQYSLKRIALFITKQAQKRPYCWWTWEWKMGFFWVPFSYFWLFPIFWDGYCKSIKHCLDNKFFNDRIMK